MPNNIVELNLVYVNEDKYKLFNSRLQFDRYLLCNKGIYIKYNNQILYLTNTINNFSPFTVVLSNEDYKKIISIFNEYDNYNILLNTLGSKLISCEQKQISKAHAHKSINCIINECIKYEEENYIIQDTFIKLLLCLKLKSKELLREYITNLIGLGEGLTPAYDDLLIGLMWAFETFSSNFDVIKKAIKDGLKKKNTTSVSYAFYKYAFERHYSYNLIRLGETAYKQNFFRMKDTIYEIKNYGHSSGKYLLYGISIGLNIIDSINDLQIINHCFAQD